MRPTETESEAARLLHDDWISDRAIAHATGTTAQLVREWSAGRATPSDEQAQRLRALSSVVERLGRVIAPPLISPWLVEPIPAMRRLADELPIRGDVPPSQELHKIAREALRAEYSSKQP